ncbi:hypothetical protein DFH29DRAFT_980968 [Suillus ampliporus]|nr:hypothetical protein DFH29DRAFT_980968 [Suillus ampliporus]
MDEEELDQRLCTLPPCYGVRHFHKGWTLLGQIGGKERKHMARVLLACLVGKVPRGVILAYCALLDFTYLAQYPTHMTPLWKYPNFGTTDNYNTEMFERFHIDFCKEGWYASNGRNEKPDDCLAYKKREVASFQSYLQMTMEDEDEEFSHSRFQDQRIILPKRPHQIHRHIADIMLDHSCNGFKKDLIFYLNTQSYRHLPWVQILFGLIRIGRLKVIFRLPQQLYGSVHPVWTKEPLAYVEWYSPLKPAAEDYHKMYSVKKPLPSGVDGTLAAIQFFLMMEISLSVD